MRKEWDPRKGALSDVLIKHRIQGMTEPSRIRKPQLEADATTSARSPVRSTSSAARRLLTRPKMRLIRSSMRSTDAAAPGATRWISARPDTVERIVVEFGQPQAISRLSYEVEQHLCPLRPRRLLIQTFPSWVYHRTRQWSRR